MVTPFLAFAALLVGTDADFTSSTGRPPTRVLIVDLAAPEAQQELAAGVTDAVARGLRVRTDMPIDVRTLSDVATALGEQGLAEARACRRGSCFVDVAARADVDAVVFGELKTAEGPRPFVAEIRVLSRDVERVTAKGDTDAPDESELIAAVEVLAAQIDLPMHAIPVVEPTKPRDIFAEPLFVTGATIVFIGGMIAIASTAYAIQSEMFLGDPDIHRDLKSDALAYGPLSIVAAAAGIAVAVVGAGIVGVSFFLPANE